jgi:glycosyltransferase involved in cell wall biosynthesis
MDILFLADNFPPEKNAQASRVFERACYWVRWGHSVTVITCAPNFPEGKVYGGYKNRWYQVEVVEGIKVIRVKTFIAPNTGTALRIVDFLSYMMAAFCAGLFTSKPDIVVATSPQFFAAIAGWALSRVKQIPFLFELSDLWPESIVAVGAMRASYLLRLLVKLELFLYKQSAAVVALTHAFKNNLVGRGIDPQKVHVVLNGVELATFRPREKDEALAAELGLTSSEIVVGYIGTLGMAHDLDNVLNAAALTSDMSLRYMFVGPGADREKLMARVAREKLENVLIVPPQPKELMPLFWSLCDIALVHLKNKALFETVIPSKIFEAMAVGKPILLVAPEGEASKIIHEENAGVWIPAGRAKELADAAQMLASATNMRQRLAAAALRAAPRYSRERQAREMLAVITNVVQAKTTPTLQSAASA